MAIDDRRIVDCRLEVRLGTVDFIIQSSTQSPPINRKPPIRRSSIGTRQFNLQSPIVNRRWRGRQPPPPAPAAPRSAPRKSAAPASPTQSPPRPENRRGGGGTTQNIPAGERKRDSRLPSRSPRLPASRGPRHGSGRESCTG